MNRWDDKNIDPRVEIIIEPSLDGWYAGRPTETIDGSTIISDKEMLDDGYRVGYTRDGRYRYLSNASKGEPCRWHDGPVDPRVEIVDPKDIGPVWRSPIAFEKLKEGDHWITEEDVLDGDFYADRVGWTADGKTRYLADGPKAPKAPKDVPKEPLPKITEWVYDSITETFYRGDRVVTPKKLKEMYRNA